MSPPSADKRPIYLQVFDSHFPVKLGPKHRHEKSIFDCWDETGYWPERLDQPRELQLLWAATYCDSEIRNGGFSQFFTNFTGVLGPEAVQGLRMIELGDCADVVIEAMEYFGHPYPRSQEIRVYSLQKMEDYDDDSDDYDPFEKLDDKYYARVHSDRLGDRFAAAADRFAERYL